MSRQKHLDHARRSIPLPSRVVGQATGALRFLRGLTAARRPGVSRRSVILATVCIALLLFCGVVQAAHSHPSDEGNLSSHDACSLCATAHVGVQVAVIPVVAAEFALVGFVVLRPAKVDFKPEQGFHLYIRPPPVALTLA